MTEKTEEKPSSEGRDENPEEWMTRGRVDSIIRKHDRFWTDERPMMGLTAAAYETRFWEFIHSDQGKKLVSDKFRAFDNQYEVNRIKPAASTFFAQLFSRRMRAEVTDSPTTTGDYNLADLALNAWMFDAGQMARWDQGVRLAVLYPGVGFKFVVDHGPGSPGGRVGLRVFPCWEAVLDQEVHDLADERYRGHVSWYPAKKICEKYDVDIKGQAKGDFLRDESDPRSPPSDGTDGAKNGDDTWVRVLELCNLVDDIEVDGERYRGRFEVHLLTGDRKDREPLYMGALPLVAPNGEPTAHIYWHAFEHRAEYPLQGLAPARQWMPQQSELNAVRSQQAEKASRDKVVWLFPEFLDSDTRTKIVSAKEQEAVGYSEDVFNKVGGDARRLIVPIQAAPQSVDIAAMADRADNDLTKSLSLSPSALGVRQNVTAEEIQYQRDFTDSEFGRYAASWERALVTLARGYLMALVSAMRPPPIEEDESDDDTIDPAATVAEPTEDDSDEPDSPFADPEEADRDPLTRAAPEKGKELETREEGDEKPKEPATSTLVLLDPKGAKVTITPEDIDSDFVIGFTDGGRTPAARAEIRTNLQQVLPTYLQLWSTAVKGGPDGVAAMAAVRAMFDNFALPQELDPDAMLRAVDEEKAKASKQPQMPPPGGEPMERAAAEPPPTQAAGPTPEQVEQVLTQIEQQFANEPQVASLVARIRALPPDQKMQATAELAQKLQQAQPQQPGVA